MKMTREKNYWSTAHKYQVIQISAVISGATVRNSGNMLFDQSILLHKIKHSTALESQNELKDSEFDIAGSINFLLHNDVPLPV